MLFSLHYCNRSAPNPMPSFAAIYYHVIHYPFMWHSEPCYNVTISHEQSIRGEMAVLYPCCEQMFAILAEEYNMVTVIRRGKGLLAYSLDVIAYSISRTFTQSCNLQPINNDKTSQVSRPLSATAMSARNHGIGHSSYGTLSMLQHDAWGDNGEIDLLNTMRDHALAP